MYEDDFLEMQYEDNNGSTDDFYTYNSQDFHEGWDADFMEPDDDLLMAVMDSSDDY